LAIDVDIGSATRSNRTQFVKRMIEFSKESQLKIKLIYYPPYHSKYNPIERCWTALENYWNGAILDSIETAIHWVSNMAWNDFSRQVKLFEGSYQKGVIVPSQELETLKPFWLRSENLPKWDVTVVPC
jgi:hypothetical protein